jgi:hypothetical protein
LKVIDQLTAVGVERLSWTGFHYSPSTLFEPPLLPPTDFDDTSNELQVNTKLVQSGHIPDPFRNFSVANGKLDTKDQMVA